MMNLAPRDPADLASLDALIAAERGAKQRDRLRAVRLSLDGREAADVAAAVGRSRTFVQTWAYRYRDGGLAALAARKQPGRAAKLTAEQRAAVRARVLAGPADADGGVCALRGEDVRRILAREVEVEHDSVYLYASVNPRTGASSAMLAPTVNAGLMSEHLRMVSATAGPGAHVVLVLDGAGWHVAKGLKVPGNVTLLPLPPYSPKLNPVERVWKYLRGRYLSLRVYRDYDHVFDAAGEAWNRLDADRLKSLCATEWVTPAN